MCGTPHRSRTMRTRALMPASGSDPDTTGSGATAGAAAGGAGRRHAPAARTPSKHSSRVRLERMAIKDALLAEFDHETATTRRLIERIPDERLTWKPHEKSMSLGGIATHLANIPNWGTTILDDASFDLASAPPNQEAKESRADVLAAFDAAIKAARARMDKNDAEYLAHWVLKRGGQEMFTMPRAAAF